jgi:hypothetical protein
MTTPSGVNAWKYDQHLADSFEIGFDVSVEPYRHTAYICKVCFRQFSANESLLTLHGHSLLHSAATIAAMPSPLQRGVLSGEHIVELYTTLVQYFDSVTPDAGTWKFECRHCKKRLPHRSDFDDLLRHARAC